MNIKLSKDWNLRTLDKRNLILENEENAEGYYSNINHALQSYINKRILNCPTTTIKELLDFVNDLKEEMNTLLIPLKLIVKPLTPPILHENKVSQQTLNLSKRGK